MNEPLKEPVRQTLAIAANMTKVLYDNNQENKCFLKIKIAICILVFACLAWMYDTSIDAIIYSLWPSDAIWRQRSWSTLAQVMACCLKASSHYLNQCWLIISEVQWHSHKGNFTRDASTINHWNLFENYISKISLQFPKGQWGKIPNKQKLLYNFFFHIKHSSIHAIRIYFSQQKI